MELEWLAPLNNGGCPILGYRLFRDNGLTSQPTTEVALDSNDPTLHSAVVDLPVLGRKYTF